MKKNHEFQEFYTSWLKKLWLMLRLSVLLILFASISVTASVYSQNAKLTLRMKDSKISDVFNSIEEKTGYYFFYNRDLFDDSRVVSVDVENESVNAILDEILTEAGVTYRIVDRNILIEAGKSTGESVQQQLTVKGTVTDASGAPLPGVTVIVKGSTEGTITDFDGNYTVKDVSSDAILVFSFVGMHAQEIPVAGKSVINVELEEESIGLDEVVAIGYGTVKKSNLTSSISKITNEALESRPVTNVSEAFQGQLAGVNAQATGGGIPGQDLTIRIRGVNTINGSSSPLYVIDGVPRDDMNGVNPSDIATIQVLKDASATSIYGSRGANGVILIETKTGTGKPTVTFDAYYGFQTPEKKLDLMTGPEWVAYQMYLRNAQYIRAGGSMDDPMSSRPSAYQIPTFWNTTTDFTDWQSEILRTAPIQNYEASASASGDIGSIFMSIGYMNQEGIIKSTEFDRYNIRLNGTLKITDNFKVGTNISFSDASQGLGSANLGDRQGKDSPVHHALMMSPLVTPGTTVRTAENNYTGVPTSTETSDDWGATWIDPLAQLKQTTDETNTTRIQAALWGEWKILKALTYKMQYSKSYDGITYEYFQPASVNRSAYMSSGNSYSSTTNDKVFQNTLTFDKQFGNHHLNVLAGQSAEKQEYYLATLEASGWPYETVTTLNQASTAVTATTEKTTYTNASFFGRVSYDFMEKYLFTASVRHDGSSRFGADAKWGTFPSFSAGWKLNEEGFMEDVDWVDLLKVRASYGTSGNDRIGDYEYMSQLGSYYSAYGETKQSGTAAANVANPDLKWEQTGSTDIGFDLSAFNNRLQFNFDYYRNITKNLLFDVPIPYTTGFSSTLTNIGKIRNSGWEVDVTSHNIDRAFKWDTNLNLSHNSNEVLEMGANTTQIISSINGGQFITKVGGQVSQFYILPTDGFLSTSDFDSDGNALVPILAGEEDGNFKYVDTNEDGSINSEDFIPYGSNLPDLTWGLTNKFSYKNFELSVLLQGQYGGEIYFLGARHIDAGYFGRTSYARWVRTYKPEYLQPAIPTEYAEAHGIDMSWDGKTQNFFNWADDTNSRVYDATYVRIKNITLSYNMPAKVLKSLKVNSLKVYGSVDNVYTFSDYPGYTPETSSYGNGTTQLGVDYSTYPLSRRYTLGVNLIF
ncbi:TonB-linked SusC/RagA family outer membrane protein [Mangrovibacterium diazotrophicum]|uniref:TonB-linked SusC/RagA family outer membrane protein n=2 Tax=Mangrovibacterium diazotrophicum TaxID=1261403 RepID=A0A419W579_9BACT|nr:TonB-linked SusC/RagA family outer membrane protein [Mangrovibacterium diazotrophicum]